MKRTVLALGCCLALIFCFYTAASGADVEPKVGQQLGPVKFAKPMTDEDAKYLGLEKAGEFTLKDIKSPYVLVEQFSTTCPHCMAQAPVMNNLYNVVNQDPQLKDKIKFMAVGQGNDEAAVKMWKTFHKVPFPLIADPKSALGDALNFHPYPVTMLLDKTGKIVFVHIGAFESTDEVLKDIKAAVK
jgi:peroxiredoxin